MARHLRLPHGLAQNWTLSQRSVMVYETAEWSVQPHRSRRAYAFQISQEPLACFL
jgi:hypothetical protein